MRSAVPLLLAICGSLPAQQSIRVGGKNFTESAVLAELMAQAIEAHTDLVVERRPNLGGTMICWAALTAGEIDLYAEYTGTGWATVLERADRVTDPLETFLTVQRECAAEHDVRWLAPFGFENKYALAMRAELADELGVRRVSDLLLHQDRLRVGFGIEFGRRNDGYPGLRAAYGFDFPQLRLLEHGLAYEGVRSGAIDLMDAYSTDGKLVRFGLRVLEDDRRFFPPYHAAPVVRGATLERFPEVADALRRLAFRLDGRDAQAMNYLVEVDGRAPAAVARAMLEELGAVEGVEQSARGARAALAKLRERGFDPGAVVARRPGFLELLSTRPGELGRRLLEHLWLTLLAVGLAAAVAVPLGVYATRRPRLQAALLGVAGVVQTVPSLALLAFMIPLLGLGLQAAIAALFLYALLPILRNTCTGIAGVPASLVDAARGMGMRPGEVLRLVELPLATPTIMAGVRTSAVIAIGVATLVAFIGAGGLGGPIVEGLYLNDTGLILFGAIPAALLALCADRLLGVVEARLRPAGARPD